MKLLPAALLPLLLFAGVAVFAEEAFQLTTPEAADDPVTGYTLRRIVLQPGAFDDPPAVVLELYALRADGQCARDAAGACKTRTMTYERDARRLLHQLNKADFSTGPSLTRTLMARLRADGFLPAGSVAGVAGFPTLTATAGVPTATSTPTNTAVAPTATQRPPGATGTAPRATATATAVPTAVPPTATATRVP